MMEPILQVKEIRKSFDGTDVLKGVSLDIYEGEVVVIIGPSGCGKSTLLRCINGLEQIDSGGNPAARPDHLRYEKGSASDPPEDRHGFPKLRSVSPHEGDG